MNRTQRVVFGNMGGQHQEKIQGPNDDPTYLFNTMVFEIGSNWSYVIDLMERFKSGDLKQVDVLERDWLNFIMTNKLNDKIQGDDSDKFVEEVFKKIE